MISSSSIFASDNNLSDPPKKPTFSEKLEILGSLPTLPPPSTANGDIKILSASPNLVAQITTSELVLIRIANATSGVNVYTTQYNPVGNGSIFTIYKAWTSGVYKVVFTNSLGVELFSEYFISE